MAKKDEEEMTFLEHLEVLRWVIIRSLIAIALAGVIMFLFKDIVFKYVLLSPRQPDFVTNRILCRLGNSLGFKGLCINQSPAILQNITMGGQFNMHIWVSLVGGFILAFPYVFYQFWTFISPALLPKERRYSRGAIFYSSILFLIGILFGYFILLPFSIDFLTNYSVSDTIVNNINFISYITNITTVVLACGLVFELPIVVYFLSAIGILTPKFLRKYWRHATVIILIIAAIITPPDVISQILVSLPLFLLYWVSILISASVEKKRERQNNEISSQKESDVKLAD
jgi:sec-independent protein translocase protein TatC